MVTCLGLFQALLLQASFPFGFLLVRYRSQDLGIGTSELIARLPDGNWLSLALLTLLQAVLGRCICLEVWALRLGLYKPSGQPKLTGKLLLVSQHVAIPRSVAIIRC